MESLFKLPTGEYICGVSGNELAMAERFEKVIKEYSDTTSVDSHNSVIAIKKSKKHSIKVMICSQIDEIGFLVKKILENGIIQAIPVGYFTINGLVLENVVVHGSKNIKGIIVPQEQIKDTSQQNRSINIETGLNIDELNKVVNIGDPISICFDEPCKIDGKFISGVKNNWIGANILINIAKQLYKEELNESIIYCASSQCELAGLGVINNIKEIEPDLIILIGVINECEDFNKKIEYPLGGGLVLTKGPYINKKYFEIIMKTIKDKNIKIKHNVKSSLNRPIDSIVNISRLGRPIISINVPTKFNNSPIQTICLDDVDNLINIVIQFLLNKNK